MMDMLGVTCFRLAFFCHMSHEVLVFQCRNMLKLSASGIHKRIRSTFAFHQLSINLFKIGQSPGAGAQAAQVQTISSWQQPSEFHRPYRLAHWLIPQPAPRQDQIHISIAIPVCCSDTWCNATCCRERFSQKHIRILS